MIDTISQRFDISYDSLSLTNPFVSFSRITNITSEFSERIHQLHFDTETNKLAQFTLTVFLSTANKNFKGGKFIFIDFEKGKKQNNVVVEPKTARVLGYTAGEENRHILERVVSGAAFFITLSFTCNKSN